MKLRSSIKTALLRHHLKKGTIFAGIGSSLLLISGIFIPANQLIFFGPLIILMALLLITVGLYPYQKLKNLELTPHEILILDDSLLFAWKRKPTMIIPFDEIDQMIYIQSDDRYGILLLLKKNLNSKVKLLDPHFDIKKFMQSCQKNYQNDLFFPYFTTYSFEQLEKTLNYNVK